MNALSESPHCLWDKCKNSPTLKYYKKSLGDNANCDISINICNQDVNIGEVTADTVSVQCNQNIEKGEMSEVDESSEEASDLIAGDEIEEEEEEEEDEEEEEEEDDEEEDEEEEPVVVTRVQRRFDIQRAQF